jgi:hypothetical protein
MRRTRREGSHEFGSGVALSAGAGAIIGSGSGVGAAGFTDATGISTLAIATLAMLFMALGGWTIVIAGLAANAGQCFQSGSGEAE